MKSRLTKVLCLVMCALLLITGSVFLTLAFLSDTTETVINTFTVGNVSIELNEAKVDLYGEPVPNADRVTKNDYKLIPGEEYTKDPVITVKEGSEPAYVYLGLAIDSKVAAVIDTSIADHSIADQLAAKGWHRLTIEGSDAFWTDSNDGSTSYNIYYKEQPVVALNDDVEVETFKSFRVKDNPTDQQLEAADGKTIKVKAFAVQSYNTDGHENAWKSAFSQSNG